MAGWQFKAEPRSFQIIDQARGMFTLTRTIGPEFYVIWFYDRVMAQGDLAHMRKIFNKWAMK